MLISADKKNIGMLQKRLSSSDENFFRDFFSKFDEKGNHYYLYFDQYYNFAGYGMLRTFNKYKIPSLGCIIWVEYRRLGNGTKLVNEIIAEARKLGYTKIILHTFKTYTVAIHLYENLGFKTIKEENEKILMSLEIKCESNPR